MIVVLGLIARAAGFSLLGLVRYIKDELLLVLGTSSSESAMPLLMEKLERAGCPKPIVGLVVPTGYSFNLDGTCIYMSLAALFIAQACNIPLSFGRSVAADGGGDRSRPRAPPGSPARASSCSPRPCRWCRPSRSPAWP